MLGLKMFFQLWNHINPHKQNHSCHGDLVCGELLCVKIYTALKYNSISLFIDTSCSTGIIPNTITFVHHTPSYGIE